MKPILLKQWEVRALLNGATMLARPIDKMRGRYKEVVVYADGNKIIDFREWVSRSIENTGDTEYFARLAPYQPGDLLYGKETWLLWKEKVYYRASYGQAPKWSWGWRPSVHMPKEFSRIHLEVVSVRVTNEPTESDAKALGYTREFELDLSAVLDKRTDFDAASTHLLGMKHQWRDEYPDYPWGSWLWLYEVKGAN